jgi:hypothetical protein
VRRCSFMRFTLGRRLFGADASPATMQSAEWSEEKLGDWTWTCRSRSRDLSAPSPTLAVPGRSRAGGETEGEGSVCGLCTPPTGSSA